MVPLAYVSMGGVPIFGTTRMELILGPAGYVDGARIVSTSGSARLDEAAADALHLAEPYGYVAGWFEVDVEYYD